MAVGIIASVFLVVLGLFGGLMSQAREVIDRQTAVRLTNALSDYLQEQGFTKVYDWVKSQSPPVLYAVEYRVKKDGTPVSPAEGGTVGADFLISAEVGEKSPLSSYFPAKEGKVFAIQISLSKANPVTTLPGSGDAYDRGHLAVNVKVYAIPDENAPLTANNQVLTYDLAILR